MRASAGLLGRSPRDPPNPIRCIRVQKPQVAAVRRAGRAKLRVMRLLIVALALVLTLMYFTFGLRFGYVTLVPTYLFNATGSNNYAYQLYEDRQNVGVRGTCKVRHGTATFRLLDSRGTQVAGQVCPKGDWGLNVMVEGNTGQYRLEVQFEKFTGVIDVKETRE